MKTSPMKKLSLIFVMMAVFGCKGHVYTESYSPPAVPMDYDQILQAAQRLTIKAWRAGRLDYDFRTDSAYYDIKEVDVSKINSPDLVLIIKPLHDSLFYGKIVVEEYDSTTYYVIVSSCWTENARERNGSGDHPCVDLGQQMSRNEMEFALGKRLRAILAAAEE